MREQMPVATSFGQSRPASLLVQGILLLLFSVTPALLAVGVARAWVLQERQEHHFIAAQSQPAEGAAPRVQSPENSRNLSDTPRSVDEMLALEQAIREAVVRAVPATIGLQVGGGQGSGVLVSPDGLILTAAHVSGKPGRPCQIVLSDGRVLQGITLGSNRELDASMVRVTDPSAGELPFVELGRSRDLEPGTWTIATGHPGGYEAGRPPVVRVGRINANRADLLQTDNTLVGGDSGGPLFDLDGRLIGIHSRIGDSLANNIHVPVDRYVEDWVKLSASEDFGGMELPDWMKRVEADDGIRLDLGGAADLGDRRRGEGDDGGVNDGRGDDGRPGATILSILPNSPAAEAKLQPGDRIVKVGPFVIDSEAELLARRPLFRPDREMVYEVIRGNGADEEVLSVELTPVEAGSLRPEWRGQSSGYAYGNFRPYSGVLGIELQVEANEGYGVVIDAVRPGGPAAEAGLKPGDTVLTLNGMTISDNRDLSRQLYRMRGGDRVELRVQRGEEQHVIPVVLENFADVYGNG